MKKPCGCGKKKKRGKKPPEDAPHLTKNMPKQTRKIGRFMQAGR